MKQVILENFDSESLIPPTQEKIEVRNQIINKTIINFGIYDKQKILHLGCGSRKKSLLNDIKEKDILYTGVDADRSIIDECMINTSNPNFKFHNNIIQSYLDENSDFLYEWSILEGILDKDLYDKDQYVFLDTIIRKCLYISESGVIVYFDSKKTENESNSYNIDFIYAYLMSTYNKVTISRLNKYDYVFCIYKYYI